jgi:hypothetical protein
MTHPGGLSSDPPALSGAVIDAISARLGVDPTELPPIYQAVDLDALDKLFLNTTPVVTDARVSFHYQGLLVCVYADGRVELDDVAGEDGERRDERTDAPGSAREDAPGSGDRPGPSHGPDDTPVSGPDELPPDGPDEQPPDGPDGTTPDSDADNSDLTSGRL